jgi:hypothetical protein
MYQNSDYSSKWFYAFITRKEYLNPETTAIYFEIDPYQSYQFELNFLPSFVEREHCQRWNSDGTPVTNTVPENLEIGTEYDVVKNEVYSPTDKQEFLLVSSTDLQPAIAGTPSDTPPMPSAHVVQGMLTGLNYYIITGGTNGLATIYQNLSTKSQYMDCIISISYLPAGTVDQVNSIAPFALVSIGANVLQVKDFTSSLIQDALSVDKYSGFPTVTESKLLMFPYAYTELTAYNGEHMEIKNEYVTGNTLTIQKWGYLNPDTRQAFVVKDYNGDTSLNNAIIVKDYPQLPTASNGYQQYLARNKSQNTVNMVTGIAETAGGIGLMFIPGAEFGGGMAIASGIEHILGTLGKMQDAKRTPNSMQTQQGGSGFNIANGIKGFTLKKKMIKPEYQNIVSQFWKAYGYKINQVKVPNLKTRQHFNYVKTIGANITGNVPMDELQKVKAMFNAGITLWHTTDIGNYSLTNGEV